jgi:hypothetical protein
MGIANTYKNNTYKNSQSSSFIYSSQVIDDGNLARLFLFVNPEQLTERDRAVIGLDSDAVGSDAVVINPNNYDIFWSNIEFSSYFEDIFYHAKDNKLLIHIHCENAPNPKFRCKTIN